MNWVWPMLLGIGHVVALSSLSFGFCGMFVRSCHYVCSTVAVGHFRRKDATEDQELKLAAGLSLAKTLFPQLQAHGRQLSDSTIVLVGGVNFEAMQSETTRYSRKYIPPRKDLTDLTSQYHEQTGHPKQLHRCSRCQWGRTGFPPRVFSVPPRLGLACNAAQQTSSFGPELILRVGLRNMDALKNRHKKTGSKHSTRSNTSTSTSQVLCPISFYHKRG